MTRNLYKLITNLSDIFDKSNKVAIFLEHRVMKRSTCFILIHRSMDTYMIIGSSINQRIQSLTF